MSADLSQSQHQLLQWQAQLLLSRDLSHAKGQRHGGAIGGGKDRMPVGQTTPKSKLVENHNKALSLLHADGDTGQIEQAIRLYRQNAHLGFAGSQNNFGDLFEDGDLVPKDLLLQCIGMHGHLNAVNQLPITASHRFCQLPLKILMPLSLLRNMRPLLRTNCLMVKTSFQLCKYVKP